jgi:hypothetical protein
MTVSSLSKVIEGWCVPRSLEGMLIYEGRVCELTSAEALGGNEVAAASAGANGQARAVCQHRTRGRRDSKIAIGLPPFLVDMVLEYFVSIREGDGCVASTAAYLLGRAPVTYTECLRFGDTSGDLSS